MFKFNYLRSAAALAMLAGAALVSGSASASPFPLFPQIFQPVEQAQPAPQTPPVASDSDEQQFQLPARFKRTIVDYPTREAPGTIIIDTPNTYLYLVLGNGQAMRYGIGVGREGFTWAGIKHIERKAEWPDWIPPQEMLARQPYLPRFMAGGPGNPLGARAMYLSGSVYRIHGTNAPSTIGKRVSSGCIRLTNADVTDLYSRVKVGAKVIVLPMTRHAQAAASEPKQVVASYAQAQPTAIRAAGLY
jgi:lipoprotein-anchoring transpeptidase ErfK/SrfK